MILPIYLSDGTRAESTGQDRGIADNVAKCLRSLRKPGSVKIFAQTLFCPANLLWFQGYLLANEMGGFGEESSTSSNSDLETELREVFPRRDSRPNLSRQIPKYWIVIRPPGSRQRFSSEFRQITSDEYSAVKCWLGIADVAF